MQFILKEKFVFVNNFTILHTGKTIFSLLEMVFHFCRVGPKQMKTSAGIGFAFIFLNFALTYQSSFVL